MPPANRFVYSGVIPNRLGITPDSTEAFPQGRRVRAICPVVPGSGECYAALMRRVLAILLLFCVVASYAQYRSRRYFEPVSDNPLPQEMQWEVNPLFQKDVFTFVRLRYDSYRGRDKWATDYPDCDYNFSYRLQQVTSLKVAPEPVILRITDPRLFEYPWVYMIEPGDMILSEEEVVTLRRYLLSGGFLMVDDFWGEAEWRNFYEQIKRVFPDREPQELPITHPVFHCVLPLKEKPQIPNIYTGVQSQHTGVTWERWDAQTPHYKGIFDDNGRMMAIICHNTDLGDGWEREGESEYYFREFSEAKAYPMGINIVFYAMTH